MSDLNLESFDRLFLVAIIMGVIKFLYELGRLYKSFQENRYYSLDRVKDAFETREVDVKLKKILIDTYEKEIFHKVYRLSLEKEYRYKIINISQSSHEIECATFRKANKYIKYKNDKINLEYRNFYVLKRKISMVAAYTFYTLFGLFVFGFVAYLLNFSYVSTIYMGFDDPYDYIFWMFYTFSLSFIFLKDEVALESAIKLKKYADCHQNDIEITYKETWLDKITTI